MTLKEKLLFGAAIVVVAIIAMLALMKTPSLSLGAAGGLLAEHYLPFVAVNGGYNSALPVQTSSFGTFSTLKLTNGTLCTNFFATSTATALHIVASSTPTLPHGAAAVLTANYGACTN